MRPSQQKNRMRGRGRKQPNPMSRNFESNGPDVKIRGNAAHIAEKYMTLARDAASAGDRVMAENYLQHAEHYNRIVAAAAANSNRGDEHSATGRGPQPDFSDDDNDEEDDASGSSQDNQARKDEAASRLAQPGQNRNRFQTDSRTQYNGAPASGRMDTASESGRDEAATSQADGSPERPVRESRGRRRPRKPEPSSTNGETGNGRADDSIRQENSSSRSEGRDISSDAAKLPGSLLGVGGEPQNPDNTSNDD
jgi:hypothetical protein